MAHRTLLVVLLTSSLAYAQETQRRYLSGKGTDDAVSWEFFCTAGAKSGQWTTIPVPSCWDALGFGSLNYRNEPPPHEQGKYRLKFNVPAEWRGQRVFLVFDGVLTDTEVLVNKMPVGPKHQGGFYRFSYDITPRIDFDDPNLLEVTVDKRSADESINRAERNGDYWLFSGIFRPVWLEAKPQHHIERIAIDARADGSLAVDVFTGGQGAAERVEARVRDGDGRTISGWFAQPLEGGKARVTGKLDGPKLWTAETPNLHELEVQLIQGETVVHRITQRFGFRTIEVRPGDGVYVNGKRILLKGSNRHSFHPESGRALSEQISRSDVLLMKEMNHNAVRMSHYPPDEHFLDACDELGLYVLDELAGWQKFYDEAVGRRLVGQMIRRDVNHPSILFWDNGNEGGWNTAIDDEFAKWDPQRRHVLHPWELHDHVNTKHYRNYTEHVKLLDGPDIYMPTEFLHGLFDGGHGAGLAEYWDAMRSSKFGAGGFLWAFVDETVKRPDTGEMDTAGNQAPDGIVGPYRQREASFYAIKEIWSPIVVRRIDDGFEIENRYDFKNAKQCKFAWQFLRYVDSSDTRKSNELLGMQIVSASSDSYDIPPGDKRSVKMELPPRAERANAVSVTVYDPRGEDLWTWAWMLNEPQLPKSKPAETSKTETADAIEIKVGELQLAFGKRTGQLERVARGGKPFALANGPRLSIGEARLESLTHREDGADVVVDATYSGNMKRTMWRVQPDGWVELDYAYALEGDYDYFGISFDLPESDVKSMRWLGDGPFRVWKNRTAGVSLGVWDNTFNDTMTGYSGWTYPEFKGCYAGVRWMRLDTTAGPIVVAPSDPSLYVQLLRPKFPGDPKPFSPTTAATRRAPLSQLAGNAWANLPDVGLSILHAIPPIGSKFQHANTTGPRGQQTRASGEYRGRVKFFFGDSPRAER